MSADRSALFTQFQPELVSPQEQKPESLQEPSKSDKRTIEGESPPNERVARPQRKILTRDFLSHVIGTRLSPSRNSYHCLDPVKFDPLETSRDPLDMRRR